MSQRIITAHGLDWLIDTDDWSDHDAADACSGLIEDALLDLSPDTAREYHALLKQAADDVIDWSNHALDPINKIGSNAASEVMKDWASQPDTGHNYHIEAA